MAIDTGGDRLAIDWFELCVVDCFEKHASLRVNGILCVCNVHLDEATKSGYLFVFFLFNDLRLLANNYIVKLLVVLFEIGQTHLCCSTEVFLVNLLLSEVKTALVRVRNDPDGIGQLHTLVL